MKLLRQKMIDAMLMRGFSARTHQSYLYAVVKLVKYYQRAPDQLTTEEIQHFFLHLLKDLNLTSTSCRLYYNGIRFFYLEVLQWPAFEVPITLPKQPQRIPELLTRTEVARIISACANPKHRMMLTICYGCGLRVSELVALKVRHIDGERHLLRVEQGKGAKDRQVEVPAALLHQLRRYWQTYRPQAWLFPNSQLPDRALSITTAQRAFTAAKRAAGIMKVGGIHSLRHAYATHQLEAGLPVHQLQRLLGHQDIHSTLRYVHWVPNTQGGNASTDLIAALEVIHE